MDGRRQPSRRQLDYHLNSMLPRLAVWPEYSGGAVLCRTQTSETISPGCATIIVLCALHLGRGVPIVHPVTLWVVSTQRHIVQSYRRHIHPVFHFLERAPSVQSRGCTRRYFYLHVRLNPAFENRSPGHTASLAPGYEPAASTISPIRNSKTYVANLAKYHWVSSAVKSYLGTVVGDVPGQHLGWAARPPVAGEEPGECFRSIFLQCNDQIYYDVRMKWPSRII